MAEVAKEDEARCEHCKFCAVRCDSWDNEKIDRTKSYYCKFSRRKYTPAK